MTHRRARRLWGASVAALSLVTVGLVSAPLASAQPSDPQAGSGVAASPTQPLASGLIEQPSADPAQKGLTDRLPLAERVDGKIYYRIPAITSTPKGDLIAAFDMRPLSANDPDKRATDGYNGQDWFKGMKTRWKNGEDSPNPNFIVQYRSTDGGKNWTKDGFICEGKAVGNWSAIEGCSDPSYVVDWDTGTIYNFHVLSYEAGIQEAIPGNDHNNRHVIQVQLSTSTDDGKHWTHETITSTVTPDPAYQWRFAASGQGTQIRHGKYKGRLVQQFTRALKHGGAQEAFSLYSPDHGKTWIPGNPVGTEMDENKVVERSNGSLLLSSRDRTGNNLIRWESVSTDGGQNWSAPVRANNIVDGKTNGQPIRAFPLASPEDPRSKVLLFANAQKLVPTNNRHRGTIWMSCDDGKTWPISKVFREDSTGYATITVQPDGRIGLLTEDGSGNNKELGIYYRSFGLDWLGKTCASMESTNVVVEKTPGTANLSAKITSLAADPSGTVKVEGLPQGWTAPDVAVTADNVGAVPVVVNVPASAGDNDYKLTLRYEGTGGATAAVPVTVTVKDKTRLGSDQIAEVWANSHDAEGAGFPIAYAFDNNPSTFWHSQWKAKPAELANNHDVVVTLARPTDLTKITYLPPQRTERNGSFRDYTVSVAAKPEGASCQAATNWAEAGKGSIEYQKSAYTPLSLDPEKARGVQCAKIHVSGEQNAAQGGTNAAAAEIRLYGVRPAVDMTDLIPAAPVYAGVLELSTREVPQGGKLTISGSNFAPGEKISVEVHSDPVVVDDAVTVNPDGGFELTWTVPEDFAPGEHTVVAAGAYTRVEAGVTVRAAVPMVDIVPADPVDPPAPVDPVDPVPSDPADPTNPVVPPVVDPSPAPVPGGDVAPVPGGDAVPGTNADPAPGAPGAPGAAVNEPSQVTGSDAQGSDTQKDATKLVKVVKKAAKKLAFTGSEANTLLASASVMLMAGALLVLSSRRRRG